MKRKEAMQVYEVFARTERGDPLRSIGNLNAPDAELARIYAYQTYDEERWFDMWVVPRDRFLEVFNADHGTTLGKAVTITNTPGAAPEAVDS